MSDLPRVAGPGVYEMDAETYFADPAPEPSLSSSGARKLLAECPARFWHERQFPPAPTDALSLGAAAHAWLLEGESWQDRHLVLPPDHNGSTKEGKARIADAKARGVRPVKTADFEAIGAMRDALAAHEFAGAAFEGGRPETALFWRDEAHGVWCRARLDFLPAAGRVFADYKTCRSAAPEAVRRSVAAYGYHQQAAWYCDGIRKLGLCHDPIFLFIFQESTPPYLITCASLDEDAIGWGRQLNEKARAVFARCLRENHWPGYADEILTVGLPGWETDRLRRLSEAGALDAWAEADAPRRSEPLPHAPPEAA